MPPCSFKLSKLTTTGAHTLVCAFLGSSLIGCATSRPPTFQDASFDTSAVEEIVVLSVIDARVDKKKNFKWDRMLPNPTKDKLKGKGYKARVHLDPALVTGITQEAIQKADPNWIKGLGPTDSNWLWVWSVTDVSHKTVTYDNAALVPLGFWGPQGEAGMAAILFNKKDGTIAWRNESRAKTQAAFGLIGMAFAGLADNDAIEKGFHDTLSGFPKRPK